MKENKRNIIYIGTFLVISITLIVIGFKSNEMTPKEHEEFLNEIVSEIKTAEASIASEDISTSSKSNNPINLEIQDGWRWLIDGDYTYIRGRVKNTGTSNIKYFEVIAEYIGSDGTVLDTDYTNSGQILKPNNMEEFEIMHKKNYDYVKVQISVSEVKAE